MRKMTAAAGTAVFLVIAPGVAAGLVPWWLTGWVAPELVADADDRAAAARRRCCAGLPGHPRSNRSRRKCVAHEMHGS
jgi:hypothetical protein